MKRERPEPSETRRGIKRHLNQERMVEEQPQKQGFKPLITKSLSERVYNQLDELSRYLNEAHCKNLEESIWIQIKELFMVVSEALSLQQLHHLQYSNRLFYIKIMMEKKKLKQKNWDLLGRLIEEEIGRVEKLYNNYLNDYSFLTILKQKYSQPFSQM